MCHGAAGQTLVRDPGLLRRNTRRPHRAGPSGRGVTVNAFGIGGFRMLREVDAGGFVLGVDPEPHNAVDQLGQQEGHMNAYPATTTTASTCFPSWLNPPP